MLAVTAQVNAKWVGKLVCVETLTAVFASSYQSASVEDKANVCTLILKARSDLVVFCQ